MILVIGGYAAGKREYVKKTFGFGENEMADGVLNEKPVIYNLQDLVARDPENAANLLEALCEKQVVICNEVGSSIVPMERKDREAREAAGRLCILLAQRAQKVVRIVCGLPQVLKG